MGRTTFDHTAQAAWRPPLPPSSPLESPCCPPPCQDDPELVEELNSYLRSILTRFSWVNQQAYFFPEVCCRCLAGGGVGGVASLSRVEGWATGVSQPYSMLGGMLGPFTKSWPVRTAGTASGIWPGNQAPRTIHLHGPAFRSHSIPAQTRRTLYLPNLLLAGIPTNCITKCCGYIHPSAIWCPNAVF